MPEFPAAAHRPIVIIVAEAADACYTGAAR